MVFNFNRPAWMNSNEQPGWARRDYSASRSHRARYASLKHFVPRGFVAIATPDGGHRIAPEGEAPGPGESIIKYGPGRF